MKSKIQDAQETAAAAVMAQQEMQAALEQTQLLQDEVDELKITVRERYDSVPSTQHAITLQRVGGRKGRRDVCRPGTLARELAKVRDASSTCLRFPCAGPCNRCDRLRTTQPRSMPETMWPDCKDSSRRLACYRSS